MSNKLLGLLTLLMVVVLVLSACAPSAPEPTQPPAVEKKEGQGLPGELEGMTWDEILAAADGQEVNWWMWGGSTTINSWVTGWLADQLKEEYNITLNQVPVAGPTEFINQVLGEKEAGQDTGGAVDIMWINGENFRTMKEANLLYGPWSEVVPSAQYYDWSDPAISYDFGYPVEGFEIPYNQAQMVLEYDMVRVPEPPEDMAALVQWIKDNPGKFTYPAPPDFTGSAWVRTMCYHATGGHEQFLGDFDQALFDEKLPACWDLLNEIEPYLWREGQTYPESRQQHVNLFANTEVDFAMAYGPTDAQTNINEGIYPETVRTYVLEDGTIANTNYIAVAYNADNLPAAVVAANSIASPEPRVAEVEYRGAQVALWVEKLPQEYQDRLAAVERGPAVLPNDVLAAHRLPELQSTWLVAIEEGWIENVLKQ